MRSISLLYSDQLSFRIPPGDEHTRPWICFTWPYIGRTLQLAVNGPYIGRTCNGRTKIISSVQNSNNYHPHIRAIDYAGLLPTKVIFRQHKLRMTYTKET